MLSPLYPLHAIVLTGDSLQTVTLSSEITPESIFGVVDETAEFPGGMEKYYQYVGRTMRYPPQARRKGIEGKVFVEFVVGVDGQIEKKSVRAIVSPSPILSAEAERVVRESAAWKAGKKNGKCVRQLFVLPHVFRLQ